MADHNELVGELFLVEKMNTADRLKHAKKRRASQLKKWSTYDKQCEKEDSRRKKTTSAKRTKKSKSGTRIKFEDSVTFLEAASRNDVEEVRHLLMKGISPDVANQDGLTAMHQCCIDDSEEMLKLLMEFGANLNARDTELWTPLHAAATCGHIHLCKYLIENNAELLAVNADGNMPYDICEDERTLDYIESEMAKRAITQEHIDDTRLSAERIMLEDMRALSEQGKDLDYRDRNGATPLHVAAANGYLSVAEFLLDHHVSLDSQDSDSWQPIHAAACWGQSVMLELLIENGADVDAKTKNGETPYDICEDPEFKQRISEIKEELFQHKKTHKTELTRKRSHNTRSLHTSTGSLYSSNTSLSDKNPLSASVRRTSMREKTMISWKEAREEAKMIGVHSLDNNNVKEEEGPEKLPQSNIDEIQITLDTPEDLPDDDEVDEDITSRDVSEKEDQKAPQVILSDKNTNHRAIIQVSTDDPDKPTVKHGSSVKVDPPPPMDNKSDSLSSTKVSVKVENMPREETGKGMVKVSSNKMTVSVKNETKEEKTVENLKKKEIIDSQNNARQNKTSPSKLQQPQQQKVVVKVTRNGADDGSHVQNGVEPSADINTIAVIDNASDVSQASSVASNRSSRQAAGKGTLNELKRQRAARLQEQLSNSQQLPDSEKLKAELADMSGQAGSGATSELPFNGNGTVTNHVSPPPAAPPRRTLNIPPHGPMGNEKKYKFSDTGVIGGVEESSNNCCVVM